MMLVLCVLVEAVITRQILIVKRDQIILKIFQYPRKILKCGKVKIAAASNYFVMKIMIKIVIISIIVNDQLYY